MSRVGGYNAKHRWGQGERMNSLYWINTIMSTMYSDNARVFYVGLSSTQPNSDGSGVSEPVGNGYSRVRVASFTSPVSGRVSNTNDLEFNRSTDTWFTDSNKAAYWVLFDGDGEGANVLSFGLLDEPKCIESNTVVKIAANSLSITLSDYQVKA